LEEETESCDEGEASLGDSEEGVISKRLGKIDMGKCSKLFYDPKDPSCSQTKTRITPIIIRFYSRSCENFLRLHYRMSTYYQCEECNVTSRFVLTLVASDWEIIPPEDVVVKSGLKARIQNAIVKVVDSVVSSTEEEETHNDTPDSNIPILMVMTTTTAPILYPLLEAEPVAPRIRRTTPLIPATT